MFARSICHMGREGKATNPWDFSKKNFFFSKQVRIIPKRKVSAVLDLEEFTVLIEKEVCTGETWNNIKHP